MAEGAYFCPCCGQVVCQEPVRCREDGIICHDAGASHVVFERGEGAHGGRVYASPQRWDLRSLVAEDLNRDYGVEVDPADVYILDIAKRQEADDG